MHCLRLTAILAVVLGATAVQAEVKSGLAVGVMEYVGASEDYLDTYPCVGGYLSFTTPVGTLSPGLCVEFALVGLGYWGVFPSVVLDIPLTDSVGLDLIVSAWSDHDGGDFANAAFYGGGGVGASYFLDDHWTVSASFNAFAGLNDAALGAIVAPGVAASYTF